MISVESMGRTVLQELQCWLLRFLRREWCGRRRPAVVCCGRRRPAVVSEKEARGERTERVSQGQRLGVTASWCISQSRRAGGLLEGGERGSTSGVLMCVWYDAACTQHAHGKYPTESREESINHGSINQSEVRCRERYGDIDSV